MGKNEAEAMLTVDQAAKRLQISRSTFDRLRKSQGGPCGVKVAGRVRFSPADLSAWLESQRGVWRPMSRSQESTGAA